MGSYLRKNWVWVVLPLVVLLVLYTLYLVIGAGGDGPGNAYDIF